MLKKLKDWQELTRWKGFSGGSEGKAYARNAVDLGSIPPSGRSSGEGNGHTLQYSCLENSMELTRWKGQEREDGRGGIPSERASGLHAFWSVRPLNVRYYGRRRSSGAELMLKNQDEWRRDPDSLLGLHPENHEGGFERFQQEVKWTNLGLGRSVYSPPQLWKDLSPLAVWAHTTILRSTPSRHKCPQEEHSDTGTPWGAVARLVGTVE